MLNYVDVIVGYGRVFGIEFSGVAVRFGIPPVDGPSSGNVVEKLVFPNASLLIQSCRKNELC